MNPSLAHWCAERLVLAAAMAPPESEPGKWVFVGALVVLLVWLISMPRQLIGQADGAPPWWRNVRVWAIVICAIQIWVYWQFA